ncbi:MAG: hypothetical protein ISR69_01845 [Gammaproteobacteria bacterium]|nr:hypothetical protein [Gammaproteobacteria bacterium]
MKASIKLATVAVLVLSSGISMAELSYDPTENYYTQYYGAGAVSGEAVNTDSLGQTYDPILNYYSRFYGEGSVEVVASRADDSMADPTNFYQW